MDENSPAGDLFARTIAGVIATPFGRSGTPNVFTTAADKLSSSHAPATASGSKGAGAPTNPFAAASVAPHAATGSIVDVTHHGDSMEITGRVRSGDLVKVSIIGDESGLVGVCYTNLDIGGMTIIRSNSEGYLCKTQMDREVINLVKMFL